jgi:hypothetical protein
MSTRNLLLLLVFAGVVAGAAATTFLHRPPLSVSPDTITVPASPRKVRQALFELLQPVTLSNCTLQRFGESHDGGYLMCANLLGAAKSGYSYGISGYDKWGCDISRTLNAPVHQYDCFNLTRPVCAGGKTVFHEECVGASTKVEEGRAFDSIERQFEKNGDGSRQVVMKMDVEGAEWDSFLHAPDPVIDQIEQLSIELHGVNEARYIPVIRKLKRFFYVAHIHFNNYSCQNDLSPFPSWAYEVLFVNKRIGTLQSSGGAPRAHPLDAPNRLDIADCQLP